LRANTNGNIRSGQHRNEDKIKKGTLKEEKLASQKQKREMNNKNKLQATRAPVNGLAT
jgi:hypothetical protein